MDSATAVGLEHIILIFNLLVTIPNSGPEEDNFYNNADSSFTWFVGGSGTAKTALNSTSVFLVGLQHWRQAMKA